MNDYFALQILHSCWELCHKSPTRTSLHTSLLSYQQWTISCSPEGRPCAVRGLSQPWAQGCVHKLIITRNIRCQGHHQWLWLSLCACPQGWKLQGTDRAKRQRLLSHLALCDPVVGWLHCSLGKISFLSSFSEVGLWITSAHDPEVWWLELNSQPAETQRCPGLSCVFVLFLQTVPWSKVPKEHDWFPLLIH